MEVQILGKRHDVVTASELISWLSEVPPDMIIIMAKDEEGNGYSPLYNIDTESGYLPDSTWSGEIRPRVITDELKAQGWRDEDAASDHIPCVVFWPTN